MAWPKKNPWQSKTNNPFGTAKGISSNGQSGFDTVKPLGKEIGTTTTKDDSPFAQMRKSSAKILGGKIKGVKPTTKLGGKKF